MGDFVADLSMPLVSQRGNELKELEWADFICVFSKTSEKRPKEDSEGCTGYRRVYWRCPDRTCPGRASSSISENGVEVEFSQTGFHNGQVQINGLPSCEVSLRCKGMLTREEALMKRFKAQARQYALETDTSNDIMNGKKPQAVVHRLRAAALQHPTLCGDIWLPKVYTTRQIADIRAHVNKKSGNKLVAPQTNVDIWNNLPLDHPYRYFQCARSELQGQELFFQALHDFQSPVVVNGVSQPCVMYYFFLESGMEKLRNASTLYVDATFKVVPSILQPKTSGFPYQLVNVFCLENNCVVPLFHALMPGKKELFYFTMFNYIRQHIQQRYGSGLAVRTAVADFEKALHNGLRSAFGASTAIQGCYFHFTQAIFRRVRQSTTLISEYGRNSKAPNADSRSPFHLFVREIMALPLLPFEHVAGCMMDIVKKLYNASEQQFVASVDVQKFLSYVDNTWFISPDVTRMWNASDVSRDSGNCAIECFHGNMRKTIGDHPNIWQFIRNLAVYHGTEFYTVTAGARAGTITRTVPSLADRGRRASILETVKSLNEGRISALQALINIRNVKMLSEPDLGLLPWTPDDQEHYSIDEDEEAIAAPVTQPAILPISKGNPVQVCNQFAKGTNTIGTLDAILDHSRLLFHRVVLKDGSPSTLTANFPSSPPTLSDHHGNSVVTIARALPAVAQLTAIQPMGVPLAAQLSSHATSQATSQQEPARESDRGTGLGKCEGRGRGGRGCGSRGGRGGRSGRGCGSRGRRSGRGGRGCGAVDVTHVQNEATHLVTNQSDPLTTFHISSEEIPEASLDEVEQLPLERNYIQAEHGIDPRQARLFAVSDTDKERVERAWNNTSIDIVLDSNQSFANTVIDRESFRTLMANRWVNDEIINSYLCGFLRERDAFLCGKDCHRQPSLFFNTFLMDLLFVKRKVYDFSAVRKWTVGARGGPINLRDYEKVFLPINNSNSHWMLIVLCMKTKEIWFVDSLYNPVNEEKFVGIVCKWLGDNFNQSVEQITREWQLLSCNGGPQQTNGYDCGIFVMSSASFLVDNLPLNFPTDSESMKQQRYRLAVNILNKRVQF